MSQENLVRAQVAALIARFGLKKACLMLDLSEEVVLRIGANAGVRRGSIMAAAVALGITLPRNDGAAPMALASQPHFGEGSR